MTPADAERLARARYTIIVACRAAGVVDMVAGLLVWKGDLLRSGGWPALGVPVFVVGLIVSLVVPQILVRLWRTPPA